MAVGICAANSSTDSYGFHFSQSNRKGHLNKQAFCSSQHQSSTAEKGQPWAAVTRIGVEPALTDWSPLGNQWTVFANKWPRT